MNFSLGLATTVILVASGPHASASLPVVSATTSTTTVAEHGTFEKTSSRNSLDCWRKTQRGDLTSTLGVTTNSYSGQYAAKLSVNNYVSGNAKVVQNYRDSECVRAARAGQSYVFSARTNLDTKAVVSAYRQDASGKWRWWEQSETIPQHKSWGTTSFQTKPAPDGTRAVAFAITILGEGHIILDNVTVEEHTNDSNVVNVSSTSALKSALSSAKPGDTIKLADGTYKGPFTLSRSGTKSAPIRIVGSRNATLKGQGTSSGYALHLDKANWIRLEGFRVREAKKGIVLDEASHNTLTNLDVGYAGEELILVRNYSSHNTISNNHIHHSGLVTKGYGEGVYIGLSRWSWSSASQSRTGGSEDKSDNNRIIGNLIEYTTAECVDIKEGTSNGLIANNRFRANAMSGANYADSWVDVQGNGYIIRDNTGSRDGGVLKDGYQTHVQLSGWGVRNTFTGNSGRVDASGYGIYIHKKIGNFVYKNSFTGAKSGTTNIP